MKIRNLRKQDLFCLAQLVKQAEIVDLSEKQILRLLKTDFKSILETFSVALVAEEKNQIIGFILLEEYERAKQGIIAEIGYFAVDEEHQNQKIGTSLFQEAVRRLKIKLSQKLFSLRLIEAKIDGQKSGIKKFYSSLGMEQVAEIPDYWDKDQKAIIFIKRFY